APLGGYWVVQSSFLPSLKPGDIVVAIDDSPVESFFEQQQRYISASSVTAQRHQLFRLPYLFSEQFTLTLDGNRNVTIDRQKFKETGQKTDGHWLKPGVTAYIRIPAFNQPWFENGARDFVAQFRNARTLIIDVRNNPGGVAPQRLVQALMDRPYREWKESTTVRAAADSSPRKQRMRNDNGQT
ncbi:MAG TPA: S41 family peptidase, partial [Candidatus Sulfotelmatobacter sp.]|nr:S41 family peptidase [Candidatus Sulfotelmatobacter sp.]